MELSEPVIVTPNDELIAAYSGNAGAAADPLFTNVKSELYDKGFLVATADNLIAWARTGSLIFQCLRPVGLAFLSTDCRYLTINEHLTEICGLSIADHIGRSVRLSNRAADASGR